MKKYLVFILIFFLICLHLPFLNSDPDTLSDQWTRGAWIDEGCYSLQIRNYIHSGILNMNESDGLIRCPMFGLMQLVFFKLFGTHLLTARLLVLFIVIILLSAIASVKKYFYFFIFTICIIMLEPHVFQFSHYALSEMMSNSMILFSMFFLHQAYLSPVQKKKIIFVFLSIMFISFSWYMKIQYLYSIIIVPLTTLSFAIIEWIKEKKIVWSRLLLFYLSFIFIFIFIFIYYLFWYLPHHDFYLSVFRSSTSWRYPDTSWHFIHSVYYNISNSILGKELGIYFSVLGILLILILLFFIYKKRTPLFFLIPILFSFFWILSELQKLPMRYLPNRYLLGLIIASGSLIISLVSEIILFKKTYIHYIIYLILFFLFSFNIYSNYQIFQRRTFHLKQANHYISKFKFDNNPVIGAWAPSICWENNVRMIPVWYHYFNWKNPIKKFHPRLVVSEINEVDSDSVYYFQNIRLDSISDSTKIFNLWRAKVVLYWIKQK